MTNWKIYSGARGGGKSWVQEVYNRALNEMIDNKRFSAEYRRWVDGEWTMDDKKKKLDPVTKPAYYYNDGKADVGPLDYAEQQDLNIEQHAIVKYVTRAGRKPGNSALKDYKQALFYLNRLIERETPVQAGNIFRPDSPVWLAVERRTGPADRRKCNVYGPHVPAQRKDVVEGRRAADSAAYWLGLPRCKDY